MSSIKKPQECAIVGCSEPPVDKHHIGGSSSPMIWICKGCHGRIHGLSWNADHRALTRAGLARARAEGRIGGNPTLRPGGKGREADLERIAEARRSAFLASIVATSHAWLPIVQQQRPARTWGEVAAAVNVATKGERWNAGRLRRAVGALVANGQADAVLLQPAPRLRAPRQAKSALLSNYIAAQMAKGNPHPSLRQIAAQLDAMGIAPPRGRGSWAPSSVQAILKNVRGRPVSAP